MSTLPERLEEAVKEQLDGNWAELARRAGLRPSTLQQVKRGADARASTLLRIADALSLSLEWLIRGEGPRLRSGAPEPERDDAAALAAIERTQVAEIFAELGLGKIALEAHRGSFHSLWRTAQGLLRSTDCAFTLEELVEKVQAEGHRANKVDVAADLLHCVDQGLVRREGPKFVVTDRFLGLEIGDAASVRGQALRALHDLAEIIAGTREGRRSHKHVALTVARMPVGRGRALMSEVVAAVKEVMRAAAAEDGPEEVKMVLGLGLFDAPD